MMAKNHQLLLQIVPSWIFDSNLNISLNILTIFSIGLIKSQPFDSLERRKSFRSLKMIYLNKAQEKKTMVVQLHGN